VRIARLFRFCALFGVAVGCGGREGDPPAYLDIPDPNGSCDPAGKCNRIHLIANPALKTKVAHETEVSVASSVVVAVDTYDETRDGRSDGTIYVADLGSTEPYSGISLFNPTFVPGNLRVGAGDALDLRGTYQENGDRPIKFAPGAALVQLANAIGTFRFDASVTAPRDIDINDLADYKKGRQWLNMIVRVKNVVLQRDFVVRKECATTSSACRASAQLLPETNSATRCDDPFPKAPTIVNELMDIAVFDPPLTKDTTIKELVGLVTFFCNLHIAPRTSADIVR
jgi:hypothetical protein